jgi:hypothetical protein
MATIFLHQLIPNSPFVPPVGAHGRWEGLMAEQLGNIAKATPAEETSLARLAQSVPSVWGYARLFHKAWAEADHPKHLQVVELWRRFICLVALRKRRPDRPLDIRKIVLSVPQAGDDDDGAVAVTFQDAAALQWPHEIFGTSPNRPVTIAAVLHQRETVGLLLPGMLTLPGRALVSSNRSPAVAGLEFPLEQVNMPVVDRPGYYRRWLTPRRLVEVEKFLGKTGENLAAWQDRGLRQLADRLLEFRRDVTAAIEGRQPRGGSWIPTTDFDAWHLEEHSPIKLFGYEFRPEQEERAIVRVRPEISDRASRPLLDLVLVSERVESLDYAGLSVSADMLVRDLAGRILSPQTREKLAQANTLVISEAELFEPVLLRLAGGKRYDGHGALAGYLLPLTPLALAILGPRGMLDRLSLYEEAQDTIQITLKLPLAAVSVPEVSLTRVYRQGEIRDVGEPDSFAVWPDFSIPDASRSEHPIPTLVHQFLRTRDAGESGYASAAQRFRATHLLSCAALRTQFETLCQNRAMQAKPPRLQPTADENGAALMMLQTQFGPQELLFIQDAAEAIRCGVDDTAALLLVDRRKIAMRASTTDTFTVAIDFGTSSTTLAFRRNDRIHSGDMAPHVWLPFHEKAVQEAREGGSNLEGLSSYTYPADHFIPPIESIRVPFLSILQVRRDIDETRRPEPLLGGRIPLQHEPGTGNLTEQILRPTPGTEIEVNLKWDERPKQRELARHFLREVMLLALGYARGLGAAPDNISWRLSLPMLMRDGRLEGTFKEDAQAAYRTAMGKLARPDRLEHPYESDAIFWYLVHQQKAAPITAILDVGGRTTDFAIVRLNRRSTHGSADLAGRLMLVDFWVERWAEFGRLAGNLKDMSMAAALQNATTHYERTALIDILLNDRNEPLEALLSANGRGQGDPLLHATRLRVQLGFLGLMYFLVHYGLAMLGRQRRVDVTQPVGVFVCGNGSKLFTSFCVDTDASRQPFVAKVESWLRTCGFADPNIGFEVTRDPKREVAIGGLMWQAMEDDPVDTRTPVGAKPGFSEQSTTFPPPPQQPHNPGIADFCEAVGDYFGGFLPSLADPGVVSAIVAKNSVDMRFLDERHRGFVGFDPVSITPGDAYKPETDPRRRFMIDLKALLLPENWTRLEAPR